MEKIEIGYSDYTRKEMESDTCGGFGDSAGVFLNAIKDLEESGYTVKFETSILRRIFGFGMYKVMAYKS